jgi:hypothetical protein
MERKKVMKKQRRNKKKGSTGKRASCSQKRSYNIWLAGFVLV